MKNHVNLSHEIRCRGRTDRRDRHRERCRVPRPRRCLVACSLKIRLCERVSRAGTHWRVLAPACLPPVQSVAQKGQYIVVRRNGVPKSRPPGEGSLAAPLPRGSTLDEPL